MLENYEKCYVKAMTFGIHDKALKFKEIEIGYSSKKKLDLHITYVKRILIFKVNKVICHFLYKDNNRKGVDE